MKIKDWSIGLLTGEGRRKINEITGSNYSIDISNKINKLIFIDKKMFNIFL